MLQSEESAMADSGFEADKDRLIEAVTRAYSRGSMDLAEFERAVARITADPEARAMEAPASLDLVELACVSGKLRQEGEWVRAERYRLYLKSSSARLDLREYEGRRGFRLLVELDLASSNLKLIVPEGFEVEDRIAERQSSTVRNRPRSLVYDDCVVTLSGSIRSSNVRVKYR
jgi:hypothetical protein